VGWKRKRGFRKMAWSASGRQEERVPRVERTCFLSSNKKKIDQMQRPGQDCDIHKQQK